MKLSAIVVFVYAFLILIGGVIGFNQAHSIPSLIAGTTSGILLLICGLGMLKRSVLAYTFAMVVIFALTLFFTYRFTITMKLMPAGMMAVLSAFSLIIISMRRKKKAKLI